MADDRLFILELVTPERVLISGLASEVILRTGEGDVTFLAGHTPLVGTVEPGVVRVTDADGEVERVAVHGGFVQVEQGVADDESAAGGGTSRVTLLVGVAELAGEIDAERARGALERAEARVTELGGAGSRGASSAGAGEEETPDADLVEAEAAVLRAQVRLEAIDASSASTASTSA